LYLVERSVGGLPQRNVVHNGL
jgi:hypothetical protein